MSLHSVLIALGALLPTAGVAFLFYVVIKAMLEGDRNERLAHSKWDAGQEHSAPSGQEHSARSGQEHSEPSADESMNVDNEDSAS